MLWEAYGQHYLVAADGELGSETDTASFSRVVTGTIGSSWALLDVRGVRGLYSLINVPTVHSHWRTFPRRFSI